MINFDKFELDNGLQVIVHQDKTTPIAAFNLLYKVGSRDENPERTGFAHLFEHLMFEGSINIKDYDHQIQIAGGENNAFTNTDITNYYITLPKQNLETAFWLESDRMLGLDFSEKKLEIQKNVVIEEFNQRYLNNPYGDWMLMIRSLAYHKHPYMWPTIGKNTFQIEHIKLSEVEAFFYKYYAPNNAILVVAGDVEVDEVKQLANKWFGPIPRRDIPVRNLPAEPKQNIPQTLIVKRDVPTNAIYKAYHMDGRLGPDYHASNLISDLLAGGDSSRLIQHLVKQKKTFVSINAYITGESDPGLFIIEGKLNDNISFEQAEESINAELKLLCNNDVTEEELTKVKNNIEMRNIIGEVNVLNKAMNLARFTMLGDTNLINTNISYYQKVSTADITNISRKIFTPDNCSTLIYKSSQNG